MESVSLSIDLIVAGIVGGNGGGFLVFIGGANGGQNTYPKSD
jgi:hypothetical protein